MDGRPLTGGTMNWADLKRRVPGALSILEMQVLADTAIGATHALEVGHFHGLSTCVLLTSLPDDCPLVTIDHHHGDAWSSETADETFAENVNPYIGDRDFTAVIDDMLIALPELLGDNTFDYVFYDADHSAEAVKLFWTIMSCGLLAPRCTLVFDDADWDEQSTLADLATADGFHSIRERDFVRHERDKKDPLTYTLEIMRRA